MLTITTTHLKANYIRRNGVPRSEKARPTEHWTRHGDYLTVTTVIEDPVFLTEPLVRSDNWALDLGMRIGGFGCEYGTLQGYSVANRERPVRGTAAPAAGLGAVRQGAQGRSLEVVTTALSPGYLRKNGAPYSAATVVKDSFDLSKEPNGDTWFVVTTIVEDPTYLTEPFVTSTNFKKQADGAGFTPKPCSAN